MKVERYFNWPGKIWIISDPHFGDEGILKYERSQFSNVEEHDKFIIKKINSVISSEDTILILGDIGFNWKEKITQIKAKYKVLILGNHDRFGKWLYNELFDEVYSGPLFINKFVVVSHEPIPISDHFLNIHGHLHNSVLDDDHHMNVSMHMIDYTPFDFDKTALMFMNYPRIRARFLKEWYRDKYVFKGKMRNDVLYYRDTGHIVLKEDSDKILEKFITSTDREEFIKDGNEIDINIISTDTIDDIVNKLEVYYQNLKGGIA